MDTQTAHFVANYLANPMGNVGHSVEGFDFFPSLDTANYLDACAQDIGAVHESNNFRDNGNAQNSYQDLHSYQAFKDHPYSAPDMMVPEQMSSSPPREHQTSYAQHYSSPPRKPDDPDNTVRPRLTPAQTTMLEDYYAHTPRPTTQQKRQLAIQLGLTLEKVNNWFQNRRAKSKQQNRIRRDFEVLDIPRSLLQQLVSPAHFGQPGIPVSLPFHDNIGGYPGHTMRFGVPQQLALENVRLDDRLLVPGSNVVPAERFQPQPPPHQVQNAYMKGNPESSIESIPGKVENVKPNLGAPTIPGFVMPNWSSPCVESPQQMDHAIDEDQLLLQQSATPIPMAMENVHQISEEILAMNYGHDNQQPVHMPLPQFNAEQSQLAESQISNHNSPTEVSFTATSNPSFQVPNFAHPGSPSTDLASNLDSVNLQKGMSSPNTGNVFKTPDTPVPSIALRRKRQRPAPLNPMRAVSTGLSQIPSPSSKDASFLQTLRRIKSTGNGLNGNSSRIQKSGAYSAQRSPLLPRDGAHLPRFPQTANPLCSRRGSLLSLEQSQNDGIVQQTQSPHLNDIAILPDSPSDETWHTNSPPDMMQAPPLSASYTQRSFDDACHPTSPPITPFTQPPMFMNLWTESAVPQSAPAHVTTFSNYSPPSMGPKPSTPNGLYAPQPFFLDHTNGMFNHPSSMGMSISMPQPQPLFSNSLAALQHFEEHDSIRSMEAPERRFSSPGDSFGVFPAQGVQQQAQQRQRPPQKEIEFVIHPYPVPKGGLPVLQRPQGKVQYTFQVSGPKDYKGDAGIVA